MNKLFSPGISFTRFSTITRGIIKITGNISSVNLQRKYFLGLIIGFSFLISFSSCKDPDELGLEVQPTSDQLSVLKSDSATLFTRTVKEDSLPSKGVSLQLLGSYTDAVFGRSDASFYTQALLGLAFSNVSDTLIPDSLVLSLAYAGHYGDTSTTQTVHVYQLTESILSDTGYYTTKTFSDSAVDLANSFTFIPKPSDSVLVGSSNQAAQLRIPLSISKASEFLSFDHRTAFSDNSNWINFFKGLYIKTDPVLSGGTISYFDLYSSYSKLTLYFKKSSDLATPLSYDFSLYSAIRVNHQEHTYNGTATDVGHQLQDSMFRDSLNYIQAMAGVKTKITFPYLKHFTDSGKIVVNKAELEITVQDQSTTTFDAPSKLLLVGIDSLGTSYLITDYFESVSYYGGSYTSSNRTYKFNIARHLQGILDGRISDSGLYLLVSGAVVQANRVIISSGKNSSYPMKLHLFYTKLPN